MHRSKWGDYCANCTPQKLVE